MLPTRSSFAFPPIQIDDNDTGPWLTQKEFYKKNKRKRRDSEVPSGLRHCSTPKIYKDGSFLRVSPFASARILASRVDHNPVFSFVELIARYFAK